jgi:hypothetical protein
MAANPDLTHDRPRHRWIAAWVVAVVGGLIVSALWWMSGSTSKKLIEDLGMPEDATDVSAIDISWADGTAPEMATRSFRVQGDAPSLKRFYSERCQVLGLSEPRAEALRLEPRTWCERMRSRETISIGFQCANHACSVFIQAEVLL